MTWPFENDTGAIVKKLAKRSLASEKRRNLMVVIAVALAAFLVCLSAVLSVSIHRSSVIRWPTPMRRSSPAWRRTMWQR